MNRLFAFAFLLLSQNALLLGQAFSSSNLPIILIQVAGDIPDEPKKTGILKVIEPSGPQDRAVLADSALKIPIRIGIEVRGSTSQFYDKKGFAIETRDSDGADLEVSILGLPEESDWILVGPFNDKSLMRDALAYSLAAENIISWTPRPRFCEVLINEEYRGVYLFTEKIKRGKNRVDISKLNAVDIAGDQVTGGYIFKIDKATGANNDSWLSDFPPFPGAPQRTEFFYHYPEADKIQSEQKNYIQDFVEDFETALDGSDWQDSTVGYRKYIDPESWANYFLAIEMTKNLDAYRLSTYFHKDRDSVDGRLKMGPVWDFNIALGIGDYCLAQPPEGWVVNFNDVCGDDSWVIPFWWQKLLQDPFFRQTIKKRWLKLRSTVWTDALVMGKIDSFQTLLNESQARNFQKFPILGTYVWPNAFVGPTWISEVDYLRDWMQSRMIWLDSQMEFFTSVGGPPVAIELARPVPNPATDQLILSYSIRQGADVRFELFDEKGSLVGDWKKLPTGTGSVVELPVSTFAGPHFWRIWVDGKAVNSGQILFK